MPVHLRTDVAIPRDVDPDERTRRLATEEVRALELQRTGTGEHRRRVVARNGPVSVSDVADGDELHEIRWDLPLLPSTSSTVTSPAAQSSALPGTS